MGRVLCLGSPHLPFPQPSGRGLVVGRDGGRGDDVAGSAGGTRHGIGAPRPGGVAQQVATIDLLSRGRVVVGAGLGSMPEEFTAFGRTADDVERAKRLDETLEVVCDLWSGGPVRHHGTCAQIDTEGLLPTPAQRPRPPIWIGGRWPNRSPFRRAARYDGVMPTHADYDHSSFMTTTELAEIVRFVREHRENGSIDVVMEGHSVDGGHLAELARDYERVGLTWWIEKLGWWRGERAAALARVVAGPPS